MMKKSIPHGDPYRFRDSWNSFRTREGKRAQVAVVQKKNGIKDFGSCFVVSDLMKPSWLYIHGATAAAQTVSS